MMLANVNTTDDYSVAVCCLIVHATLDRLCGQKKIYIPSLKMMVLQLSHLQAVVSDI